MAELPEKRKDRSTLIIAFVTALITSIVAPLAVEWFKGRTVQHQLKEEKRDRIVKTQFEVVEKLNQILWAYRTSASFLVSDYINGQTDEALFKKHIQEYEEVSANTNKELAIEAFRARMYFQNDDLYKRLMDVYADIFRTDYRIIQQEIKQNYKYDSSEEARVAWGRIHDELTNEDFDEIKNVLNELFSEIGKVRE
jgi:hypothetical protein